jgi:hypothetical protein
MNCAGANQYLACRDLDKAAGNTKCDTVLTCSRKNNCAGVACYCGDTTLNCLSGNPLGACTSEIEAAAGAGPADWYTVNMQSGQVGTPIYDANAADVCRVANCKAECR